VLRVRTNIAHHAIEPAKRLPRRVFVFEQAREIMELDRQFRWLRRLQQGADVLVREVDPVLLRQQRVGAIVVSPDTQGHAAAVAARPACWRTICWECPPINCWSAPAGCHSAPPIRRIEANRAAGRPKRRTSFSLMAISAAWTRRSIRMPLPARNELANGPITPAPAIHAFVPQAAALHLEIGS